MRSEYIIEMVDIVKKFGEVKANDHISLRLKKGEILGLCGENGAGKSTLMSILFGLYEPDEGYIKKDGEKVVIKNPNEATKLNIGMIHQHFKLVQNYTVLQNIVLGYEPLKSFKGENLSFLKKIANFFTTKVFKIIDYSIAREKVNEIIKKYNFNVDLDEPIQNLSVEMQQKTEIIKMLYRENDVLIFDEPTAVLAENEIDGLLDIIINLKKEGKSIVFISHKLNEVFKICDRITVIKKGQHVKDLVTKDTSKEEVTALMVGKNVNLDIKKDKPNIKEEILRVENLTIIDKESKKSLVNNVSFNVRRGEIVCIAGVDGNGQQELIYGISGIIPSNSGKIYINNKDITDDSVKKRNNEGISHIPEDRHKHGLVLDFDITNNAILKEYDSKEMCKWGIVNSKNAKKYAKEIIENYDVRAFQQEDTVVRSMSGGNQQKIIIGRELMRKHDLLLAVEPIRGLDVGSIESVYQNMLKERSEGAAILLVSLSLDQTFTLADRILVMFEGELVGEFTPDSISREELGLYMTGSRKDIVNAIKKGEADGRKK